MAEIITLNIWQSANDWTGHTLREAGQIINDNFERLNITKLEWASVLQKDNILVYIPTWDYHPSTKKYVDDSISWHTHLAEDITDIQSTISWNSDVSNNTAKISYTDGNKVAGIQAWATANSSDTHLLSRSNHTWTQTLSTISDAWSAAWLNVSSSWDASQSEIVKWNDSRLTNARNPLAHNHVESDISDLDKYTQLEVQNLIATAKQEAITQAKNDLTNGASGMYDTFLEIQSELQSNDTDISTILSTQSWKMDKVLSSTWSLTRLLSNGNLEATTLTSADIPNLSISKITWLQSELDDKLEASDISWKANLAWGNTFTGLQDVWGAIRSDDYIDSYSDNSAHWYRVRNLAWDTNYAILRKDSWNHWLMALYDEWTEVIRLRARFNSYINTAGNFWIGTTSPWNKLSVVGDAKVTTNSQESLTIQCLNNSDNMALAFQQAGTFYWWAMLLKQSTTNTAFRDIHFSTGNTGNVDALLKRITILWDGGNVWIGTINPSARLEVSGRLKVNAGNDNTVLDFSSDDAGINMWLYDNTTDSGRLVGINRTWDNLSLTPFWGNVWVGIIAPISKFHVYENNSDAGITQWITVEQDGAWDATLQFLRTGIRRTMMGIDGSDNKFKISTWSQWLSLWNILTLDTAWNMGLWNLISPTKKLQVSWTAGYLNAADMWTDDTDFAHKKYVDNRQVIEYSWRWYMYVWNAWRTSSNNSYWPNYYQWASSAWTGVNPVVSWAWLWSWVRAGQKIKKITISWVRRSNAELTDIEFAINHRSPNGSNSWENWIDATSEVVNSTLFKEDSFMNSSIAWQPQFNWDLSDMHSRTYEVDLEILEDGFLDFCWKPIWVLTATRFAYINYKIDLN